MGRAFSSPQPLAPSFLARDLAHTALDGGGWRCSGVPVFLGYSPDAPSWQFYHSTSRRVFPSQDVTFDESVPFYRLFLYRSAPPPPPPLFLAPGPPPVDPLPPQGPAPSSVSQVGPLPCTIPIEVAGDSGAARGSASRGAELGDAEFEGAEPGGAKLRGAEPGGAESAGVEPGGAEPVGVEIGGAKSEGAESGGADPQGAASSGGPASASTRVSPRPEPLSLQQLRELLVRRAHLRSGAAVAGATRDTEDIVAGGAGDPAGAGGTRGTAASGPRGARTRCTRAVGTRGVGGARAGDPTEPKAAGAGGTGAGGAGAGGAGAGGTCAGGAGAGGAGAVDPRVGGAGAGGVVSGGTGAGGTPPSPLPAPSPYTKQSGGLTERREPGSRRVSPVCTARRVPRSRPPPVPGTHNVALRPFSVILRVPLPPPTESSLPVSIAASALVAELLEFAAACRLDYATALVAECESTRPPSVGGECALGTDVLEDRQEEFQCLAAAVPRFASMLLGPEGDLDALNIPTPHSYVEAIRGPYSSQWQAAMDAEMASWKSTGTYVDKVPPSRANIVDGMCIFRMKWPPGSPPAFKARYIA
ncbi:unnamed protein product [Closterium sp. NIES-54]